jgi:hypothetical protein
VALYLYDGEKEAYGEGHRSCHRQFLSIDAFHNSLLLMAVYAQARNKSRLYR